MLVTRDQPGRRGAISSSVRQRSSHSVQPGVFQGSATHQFTQESRINTPLNFPQPTFGTARIVDPVGQGDGLRIPRYIIVSEESGRGWAVVDSIRDCQFGQVQRGVQVTRTSSGRWTSSTTPPFYVAIKVSASTSWASLAHKFGKLLFLVRWIVEFPFFLRAL